MRARAGRRSHDRQIVGDLKIKAVHRAKAVCASVLSHDRMSYIKEEYAIAESECVGAPL